MNQRSAVNDVTRMRTGRIDDAVKRYGIGRNSMMQLARDAKAVIRVGKCVLLNFQRIDDYMEQLSE